MLKVAPTERFSSRVETYVRFRPTYPKGVIDVLREECGLRSDSVVADIASGTGLFTRLLLENGNRVFGVEPNADMRRAGEEYLARFPNFTSVAGTAESTTLPDRSLDLITSAQAAHWFQRDETVKEFQRVLKPGHYLALVFNDRQVKGSAFADDYESVVVKYGTDYSEVQRLGRIFEGDQFFSPFKCEKRVLPNHQDLDHPARRCWLICDGCSISISMAAWCAWNTTPIFTSANSAEEIFSKWHRTHRRKARFTWTLSNSANMAMK
jgi:SAM-dependent methyltransferase